MKQNDTIRNAMHIQLLIYLKQMNIYGQTELKKKFNCSFKD